jgi:hypothetical protein
MGFDNDHLGTLMPFGAPSTPSFLAAYGLSLGNLLLIEFGLARFAPSLSGPVTNTDFNKDAAGFFLAAQVGILAVLTVTVRLHLTGERQKAGGQAARRCWLSLVQLQ